jgi:hypothetical protein
LIFYPSIQVIRVLALIQATNDYSAAWQGW